MNEITSGMRLPAKIAFPFALLIATIPSQLRAQAPAGPIHPQRANNDTNAPVAEEKKPLPRHDLWGNWTLNVAKSDDPRKKMGQSDKGNGSGNGPTWHGGVGYPGGRGGYPGHGRGYPRESNADRNRTDDLVFPQNSLSLARKDAEIDLTDDEDRKRVLYTDGRKLQKSKDDKYKELAAHWDASRLVTGEKGPYGLKIQRSFEISPNGQQLYETLAIDRGGTGGFVLIRYIFDPTKEEKLATSDTKAAPAPSSSPSSTDDKP